MKKQHMLNLFPAVLRDKHSSHASVQPLVLKSELKASSCSCIDTFWCAVKSIFSCKCLGKTKNQAKGIETVIPKVIGSDTPYSLSNPPLNTPSSYFWSAACYRVRRSQKALICMKIYLSEQNGNLGTETDTM